MVLESGNSNIILDAGSGIIKYDAELRAKFPDYPAGLPFRFNILLSHLHMDHIQGLTGFTPIWVPGTDTRIFTCSRDGKPLNEQIFGMFAPPYWPIKMASVSRANCIEISAPFCVDGFRVEPFASNHPDETLAFRITDGEKTIVYLLDSEVSQLPENDPLVEYCRNVDLIIFDATYTLSDYSKKVGWGHSTVHDGIGLAKKSGCKRVLFAHFGQEYSDADLEKIKTTVPDTKQFVFAKEDMEIEI